MYRARKHISCISCVVSHQRGYSGHYKGIEEGAAYCHTRSTTCHEQDEEEGQRRAQNIGKMKKIKRTLFYALHRLDVVAVVPIFQCKFCVFLGLPSVHNARHMLFGFVFGYGSVLFAAV